MLRSRLTFLNGLVNLATIPSTVFKTIALLVLSVMALVVLDGVLLLFLKAWSRSRFFSIASPSQRLYYTRQFQEP